MSEAQDDSMAAVIVLPVVQVEKILNDHSLPIDIAIYNSNMQIVISGIKRDVDAVKIIFEKFNAKMFIPLNVSKAFHSRYMNDVGINLNLLSISLALISSRYR
jgi:trans-AT polyketide synthase, acyltransferase and oxidoreductase domains